MTEDERLYLQFLQNNISRMNTNSSQMKGWCVAIVAALFALYADKNNPLFVWICLFPVLMFCILDSFYLQQEHKFRRLYDDFVDGKETKPLVYKMPIKSYEKGFPGFFKALKSWSVWPFYIVMIVSLFVICRISNQSIKKDEVEIIPNEIDINQEDVDNEIPEQIQELIITDCEK